MWKRQKTRTWKSAEHQQRQVTFQAMAGASFGRLTSTVSSSFSFSSFFAALVLRAFRVVSFSPFDRTAWSANVAHTLSRRLAQREIREKTDLSSSLIQSSALLTFTGLLGDMLSSSLKPSEDADDACGTSVSARHPLADLENKTFYGNFYSFTTFSLN